MESPNPTHDSPRLDRGAHHPVSQPMQRQLASKVFPIGINSLKQRQPNHAASQRVGPRGQATGSRGWRTQTQLTTPRGSTAGPITRSPNRCKGNSRVRSFQSGLIVSNNANPTTPHPNELDPVVKPRGVADGKHKPNSRLPAARPRGPSPGLPTDAKATRE